MDAVEIAVLVAMFGTIKLILVREESHPSSVVRAQGLQLADILLDEHWRFYFSCHDIKSCFVFAIVDI